MAGDKSSRPVSDPDPDVREGRKVRVNLFGVAILFVLLLLTSAASIVIGALNARDIRTIRKSTGVIERVILPVCVTKGHEDECRQLLIAADEVRVKRLCRLTVEVLQLSNLEARCVVRKRALGSRSGGSSSGGGRSPSTGTLILPSMPDSGIPANPVPPSTGGGGGAGHGTGGGSGGNAPGGQGGAGGPGGSGGQGGSAAPLIPPLPNPVPTICDRQPTLPLCS